MFTAWLLLKEANNTGEAYPLMLDGYSTKGSRSRCVPEEDIAIDLMPDDSDALFDSAQHGGQQTYQLLWKAGYCRFGSTVRFKLAKPPGNVTGHSAGLLFALATAAVILNRTTTVRPFAATGVLTAFAVKGVEGVPEKLESVLTVIPEGGIILYPKINHKDIDVGLHKKAKEKNVELYPVEHLADAIVKLFGISIEYWSGNPYRGLDVFKPKHACIFFGRLREVEFLRKRLLEQEKLKSPSLLILGGSGSGKSSFIQAGLIPELGRHFANELPKETLRWAIWQPRMAEMQDNMRNEACLVRSIHSILTNELFVMGELKAANTFAELVEAIGSAWPADVRFVLFADQLEELFTLCTNDAVPAFVDFLRQLQTLNIWLVATMRNDFYPQFQAFFSHIFDENARYDLPRLNTAALDQIIQGPADLTDVKFEQREHISLAVQLREDMAGESEALPLLEFCLSELYDQRDLEPQRMMTYAAYDDMGGLHGAIARCAEDAFSALSKEAQTCLSNVLWQLVVWSPVNNRITAQSSSIEHFPINSPARQLIDAFVDKRLFVLEANRVRITHEALLSSWPRAVEAVTELQADMRVYGRLKEQTRLWIENNKNASRLLPSGLPLIEAEDLLRRRRVG